MLCHHMCWLQPNTDCKSFKPYTDSFLKVKGYMEPTHNDYDCFIDLSFVESSCRVFPKQSICKYVQYCLWHGMPHNIGHYLIGQTTAMLMSQNIHRALSCLTLHNTLQQLPVTPKRSSPLIASHHLSGHHRLPAEHFSGHHRYLSNSWHLSGHHRWFGSKTYQLSNFECWQIWTRV